MKKKSIWLDNISTPNYKVLNQDLKVDILIIGGGITGLSTLYYLKNTNQKVCLVESNLVGNGITGKSTGKITYLQQTIYQDLEQKYSLDVAKLYLDSQKVAIEEITKIIKKEKISCNLEKVNSYLYAQNEEELKKINKEKNILEDLGIKTFSQDNFIYVVDTYVFHPLKFILGLKETCQNSGKEIYEKTKILQINKKDDYYICQTKNHKILATKIILACHYPYFVFPFGLPLKTYVEKSYITASLAKYKNKSMITPVKKCESIRYHKDYLEYILYLNNSSKISDNLNEKKNFAEIISKTKEQGYNPVYIWKNDDLMTLDGMPYIGSIKKKNNDLLIATGYNTWGMTNGVLAGKILSDIILNQDNEFIKLFSPLRTNSLKYCKEYLSNISSNLKSFIQNKIAKNKKWYSANIKFQKIKGQNVAIYNDVNKKYIVSNKCPHMGCSLIFNPIDKTWDCPCHASRFDIEGKCIKGPSNNDIKINKDIGN